MGTEDIVNETLEIEEPQSEDSLGENWEEEARYSGWTEKENFRGDKKEWLDAKTFVERGRSINPILRANNQRLIRNMEALERRNQEYADEIRVLREGQQGINERDFDTTIQELNRQRLVAMHAKDEDGFLRLDQQIQDLREKRSELITGRKDQRDQDTSSVNSQAVVDPVFDQWASENSWFGQDEVRTVIVNRIAEQMRESYPNLLGRSFLDAVVRTASKKYPEDFGTLTTSSRKVIGDISDPGDVIGHSNGKSIRDLPHDARQEMAKFVKDKLGSQDDYVHLYFEEE